MAGSKTAYLAQKVLDHCLGGAPFVPPDTVWVVVSTDPFDPNATGDDCGEVLAGDYARLQLTNDSSTWSPAAAGAPSTKDNIGELDFPQATSDWGTPGSVYLADADTAGNLLYGADVIDGADIGDGDTFTIPANVFVFSED